VVCRVEARDRGGEPGTWRSPIAVARRYGISRGFLYTGRHLLEGSLGSPSRPAAKFARLEVMAVPADRAPAVARVVVSKFSSPFRSTARRRCSSVRAPHWTVRRCVPGWGERAGG
jgi:hypothetical protein